MRRALPIILLMFFLASAQAAENIEVKVYWGEGCGACAATMPYLDSLIGKYPEVNFEKLEVYQNRENSLELWNYYESVGVPVESRKIPVVVVDGSYYIGLSAIQDNLEKKILEMEADGGEGEGIASPGGEEEVSPIESGDVSLVVLTSAALVDSINPCAIAVLIILLMALLNSGSKKRALKAGIAFSLSIYIVYFLFGIGIFSLLKFLIDWFAFVRAYFMLAVGLVAVIIGLLNLKDYFWYGAGGFVMEIPRSWRPKAKQLLNNVTSPLGAFSVGFIISLIELPCTGGPYLFILGLLAEKTTFWPAVTLLLYYNLFFVLPLLLISLLVYRGLPAKDVDAWKERNIKRIHLVTGLVMLALGVFVLAGFI